LIEEKRFLLMTAATGLFLSVTAVSLVNRVYSRFTITKFGPPKFFLDFTSIDDPKPEIPLFSHSVNSINSNDSLQMSTLHYMFSVVVMVMNYCYVCQYKGERYG